MDKPGTPTPSEAHTTTEHSAPPSGHITEDQLKALNSVYNGAKRRQSNASVKSKGSISSSRRGSKADTDDGDEFDENAAPIIPNIMYRLGYLNDGTGISPATYRPGTLWVC